jgi:hypothetical protein
VFEISREDGGRGTGRRRVGCKALGIVESFGSWFDEGGRVLKPGIPLAPKFSRVGVGEGEETG